MKKLIKIITKVLFIFFVLSKVSSLYAADTRPIIKIGVMASLSGDLAFMGETYRNAILMAQEDRPNTKYRYELVFEDCEYSAAKASTALQKLINVDKVSCLLTFFDMFGQITAPLAERHKIPHVSFSMNHETAKGAFNFVHEESAEDEAALFCQGMKKRGLKRLAVFTVKDPYSQLQRKALMQEITKARGIEVVADHLFNPTDRDFRTLVSRARDAKPEIYCLLTFSPTLDILAKQLREAGQTALSGLETFENTSDTKSFEGLWYVSPINPRQNLIARYKKRFNAPVQLGTGHAYDMYNLVVNVFETFDGKSLPNPQEVAQKLAALKTHEGTMGTAVNNAEGEFRTAPAEKIIRDGEPTEL
jgi:branched-chain amino acid transport system substrate-binding protein